MSKPKSALIVGKFSTLFDAHVLTSTGAGAGGIPTAARLAKAGFKVTVVEKNDFTGGRCSLLHHGDYVRHLLTLDVFD